MLTSTTYEQLKKSANRRVGPTRPNPQEWYKTGLDGEQSELKPYAPHGMERKNYAECSELSPNPVED